MDKFVHTLINNQSVFAQGNSTEADIRQHLKVTRCQYYLMSQNKIMSANKTRSSKRAITHPTRHRHSPIAQTLKEQLQKASMQFDIRSMFMLSSIQVSMLMQADRERITVLGLQPKRQSNAAGQWKILEKEI